MICITQMVCVEEYRNDTLLSSTMLDFQIIVVDCLTVPPDVRDSLHSFSHKLQLEGIDTGTYFWTIDTGETSESGQISIIR